MIDNLQKAANQAGGALISAKLQKLVFTEHGCGADIYISGTNGGKMTCGSRLTMLGKTEIQYCNYCQDDINNAKDEVYQIANKHKIEKSFLLEIIKDLKNSYILSH